MLTKMKSTTVERKSVSTSASALPRNSVVKFPKQNEDEWDRQMACDAAAGKFDAMIEKAKKAQRDGNTRPL